MRNQIATVPLGQGLLLYLLAARKLKAKIDRPYECEIAIKQLVKIRILEFYHLLFDK